jgi:hypothetical protein
VALVVGLYPVAPVSRSLAMTAILNTAKATATAAATAASIDNFIQGSQLLMRTTADFAVTCCGVKLSEEVRSIHRRN